MKKLILFILVSVSATLSLAQGLPQMLKPKLELLEPTAEQMEKADPRIANIILANRRDCVTRIESQMLNLASHIESEKNKDFKSNLQSIATELKQSDSRCNYFRFEMDKQKNLVHALSFSYRCYAKANQTQPGQAVSFTDAYEINTGGLFKDSKSVEEKCVAVEINKILFNKPVSPAKKDKINSTKWPLKLDEMLTKPATKVKKGSGQN